MCSENENYLENSIFEYRDANLVMNSELIIGQLTIRYKMAPMFGISKINSKSKLQMIMPYSNHLKIYIYTNFRLYLNKSLNKNRF